jgi:hypothetical protein
MKRACILVFMLAAMLAVGARAETPEAAVTAEEKAGAVGVIKALYQAYSDRDIDKILTLEHDFIEASAKAYEEKKGAGKGDELRDAFRGVTEEIIRSKQFAMKPLHLDDVQYRREGDRIVVSSAVPIIATEYVDVEGDGVGNRARLRIAKFWIRKTPEGWRIEQMDLHG